MINVFAIKYRENNPAIGICGNTSQQKAPRLSGADDVQNGGQSSRLESKERIGYQQDSEQERQATTPAQANLASHAITARRTMIK